MIVLPQRRGDAETAQRFLFTLRLPAAIQEKLGALSVPLRLCGEILPLLPFLALGLFTARLFAEALTPPWPFVIVLAALGAALGLGLARALRDYDTAPFNVLWLYVLWPWLDPGLALACGAVALLALLIAQARASLVPFSSRAFLLIIFAGGLALYSVTLAPGVLPADAGEFQVVAAQWGVAHPPGYPLYTVLAALFARLTGNPAWGVNWFSAVSAAGALALTAAAAQRVSGSRWGGLAAALALATSTSFWSTATQASIRPLTALFTAAALVAALDRGPRRLVWLAVALGLGIGHHVSLAFPGAFLVLYVLSDEPGLWRSPRRWLAPLVAFALTFAVFAYLPLRDPALVDPGALLDHVLARGFGGDMFYFVTTEPALLGDRLALLPGLLLYQFHPLTLLAAAAGAAWLLWRRTRLGLALAGAWLAHTFVTLTYRAPQTVEYMLPAYVLMALTAGCLAGELTAESAEHAEIGKIKSSASSASSAVNFLIAALILWSALALGLHNAPSFADLAHDDDTRTTARAMLDDAPPGAVLLSNWHWYTALRYLHEIEGLRPDVTPVYVYPRDEALADSWVNTIRTYAPARPVVVNQYFADAYAASGLRFEPLGREAWLAASAPRTSVPDHMKTVNVDFGGQLRLLGYLGSGSPTAGNSFVLTLVWTPVTPLTRDYHFFVHVLGPDGIPIAQSDLAEPTSQYTPGQVLVQRHVLDLPAVISATTYHLSVGVYDVTDTGGFTRLDTFMLSPYWDVTPGGWPLPTEHPLAWRFAGGPALVGYDFEPSTNALYLHWYGPADPGMSVLGVALPQAHDDAPFTTMYSLPPGQEPRISVQSEGADLPRTGAWGLPVPDAFAALALDPAGRYVPLGGGLVLVGAHTACGGPTRVDLTWRATQPLVRDDDVSVQFAGDWQAQSDGVPALGAIPTLKWLWGARVLDRHVLSAPPGAHGQAGASVVAYDAFTQHKLGVLDPQLAQQGPAVPLGECSLP
jgi:hypothetical protein